MNLTWQEVRKLKGKWLIETRNNSLVKVISSTAKHVKLTNGATVMTSIFVEKQQSQYELAPEDKVLEEMEERYRSFLETHDGEIRGVFDDKYYRNGGWNGMMDSVNDVEKRYKVEMKHIDTEILSDNDKLDTIYNETIFYRG